jgi:hypothetical protein
LVNSTTSALGRLFTHAPIALQRFCWPLHYFLGPSGPSLAFHPVPWLWLDIPWLFRVCPPPLWTLLHGLSLALLMVLPSVALHYGPSLGLPCGPSLALLGPSLASPRGPSPPLDGPSLAPPCPLFSCLSLLFPLLSSSTTYVYCLN